MRWTLRGRLRLILGLTGACLGALALLDVAMERQVEHQLVTIEQSYLPLSELGPAVESQLGTLRHALQDAVAAEDAEELAATAARRDRLLAELDHAPPVVDPAALRTTRALLVTWYEHARAVSEGLLSGGLGEQGVTRVAAMQAEQARLGRAVRDTFSLDRRKLTAAFEATRHARTTAFDVRLSVHIALLLGVALLSIGIGRRAVRSLHDLTEGFSRLGRGDFDDPVQVSGEDELSEIAQQANRMAAELRELDAGLREKQRELEHANSELEAFSYSVSHDLRAPLRAIDGFSQALLEDLGDRLDATGGHHLTRVRAGAQRMGQLIDDLLALSRVTRAGVKRESVDLSALSALVVAELERAHPERKVAVTIAEGLRASGDARMLRIVLDNLLGNAWKFTARTAAPRIEVGGDGRELFVRDNGAGFDMAFAGKLFAPFQRLHSTEEFAGTGIGLATVQRIIHRHGGTVRADSAPGQGATFRFTLPSAEEPK